MLLSIILQKNLECIGSGHTSSIEPIHFANEDGHQMIKGMLRSTFFGLAFAAVVFSLPAIQVEASGGAQVGSWSSGHRVVVYNGGGVGYPAEVSCLNNSLCVATFGDGKIAGAIDGKWTKATQEFSSNQGLSTSILVTCSASITCLEMDSSGDMVGNRTTMPKSSPNSIDIISGLACPSSSFCVAVTGSGTELTYSGGKWSAPYSVDPISAKQIGLTSISCPSISFCIAVDSVGAALKYSDGKWSRPDRIDPQSTKNYGLGFVSVSCSSSNFCIAIDGHGYGFSYSKGSWSKRRSFDTSNAGPASVSCASRKFCVSVDNNGYAIDYVDGQWKSPNLIDPHTSTKFGGDVLTSVSCPSSNFCVAVDQNGYAFEYTKN